MSGRVLWCPRPKGAHRLVWLEADESGNAVLCVAAVAPGTDRLRWGITRVDPSVVRGPADDPFFSHTTMAGCACKARYIVDLVAFLNGRPKPPRRITGDDFPGVSHDR